MAKSKKQKQQVKTKVSFDTSYIFEPNQSLRIAIYAGIAVISFLLSDRRFLFAVARFLSVVASFLFLRYCFKIEFANLFVLWTC